jgi:NitT/TauT family transport system substrate-binding protein
MIYLLKREWLLTFVLLISITVIFPVSPSDAAAKKEEVSVRLDWVVLGYHAPFFAALDKGYFDEQDLQVTIQAGQGSSNTIQLVGSGANTVGFAGFSVLAQAMDKGVPVKAIFGMYQKNPQGIISFKEKKIQSPKDLVGKSVVMSTTGIALFPIFLKANKIDPQSVKVVTLASLGAREVTFLEGKVDGLEEWGFTKIPTLEEAKKAEYSFMNFSDYGTTLMSNGIIAGTKTINERPEVLRKFLAALKKGIAFAKARPEEAIDLMIKRFPEISKRELFIRVSRGSFDYFETENNKGRPLGWMSDRDWRLTLDSISATTKLEKELPLDAYYTNALLPK